MANNRISFLNGQFLPHENCFVHIEDRGFQFADGVYEVTLFRNGKLVDDGPHLDRLFYSLKEINITHDFTKSDLRQMMLNLFANNNLQDGSCYLQITRGTHNRIQFCPQDMAPSIIATVVPAKIIADAEFDAGFSVMTHDDIRWKRCNIKTVSLLASTLINQKAKDAGFSDAILVRDGIVTEATFANVFMVDQSGTLITKDPDYSILRGITRNRFIDLATKAGLKVEERGFSVAEMLNAKEIFLTSSTLILRPIVKIDDKIIGNGRAGAFSHQLRQMYHDFIQ